jgi:hypothetical protein
VGEGEKERARERETVTVPLERRQVIVHVRHSVLEATDYVYELGVFICFIGPRFVCDLLHRLTYVLFHVVDNLLHVSNEGCDGSFVAVFRGKLLFYINPRENMYFRRDSIAR